MHDTESVFMLSASRACHSDPHHQTPQMECEPTDDALAAIQGVTTLTDPLLAWVMREYQRILHREAALRSRELAHPTKSNSNPRWRRRKASSVDGGK